MIMESKKIKIKKRKLIFTSIPVYLFLNFNFLNSNLSLHIFNYTMKTSRFLFVILLVLYWVTCNAQVPSNGLLLLKDNWTIQSSKEIKSDAKAISTTGFNTDGWYRASVPTTVLAALVANNVYPDPYFGTNIKNIPGQFADRKYEIPNDSPFKTAWWYRTEFRIPAEHKNNHTWLRFQSINYRANIWLNGKLIADTTAIEGAYRLYNLDISKAAIPGENNCLAIQIYPPKGFDLTITWVDWNPTPPDRGMGIWYDVSVHSTGDVSIEDPHVVTKLNLPAVDQAKLTVSTEVRNAEPKEVTGILKGTIENISFSQEVTLGPGESKLISFTPEIFPQLVVKNPRLWWPHAVGPQNLYDLNLSYVVDKKVSDSKKVRFGIREISAWMNDFDKQHTRVFQVNGKNIVIRGGGYVQDLLLRPSDERIDADILYAKHMNLNCLRMEAPRGSDYLFEKCDEEGILLMVGWCCCSSWERWKNWTPHIADIAEISWKDQIVHLRNHPSVFCWLYGSDNFPPADIEKRYLKVLDDYDTTRPYESSATQAPSSIQGNTGVYMGPYPKVYAYETPSYWYSKMEFNTEAGPAGEQIPPIETLKKMMPEKDLWPMSPSWDIRLHKAFFPIARAAFESRYGKPAGLEEYCVKAQMFQNEAVKAMFEAFAGNKYRSSGIIYWMYNSAWPKMYWQLYDYFFMPNGAFYGAKTACEPLHIQYCYDDKSVKVVNSYYQDFKGLTATIGLYDFNMKVVGSEKLDLNIEADGNKKISSVEVPAGITPVYFLKLKLNDAAGKEVSSNFYWLSSNGDDKADFTDLSKLPEADVNVSVSGVKKEGGKYSLSVTIVNNGKGLAFAVNPKILKLTSKDPVLPVFWQDNYISLLPSEKKVMKVEFETKDLGGEKPLLKVDGWNIKPVEKEIK
jgi:exo-1,4-beta-D-glucosaminidase